MSELKIERGDQYLWCACPEILNDSVLDSIRKELMRDDLSLILDLLKTEELDSTSLPVLREICEKVLAVPKSLIFVCTDPKLIESLDHRWTLVPTMQEAMDFLEMEEIERSLGF